RGDAGSPRAALAPQRIGGGGFVGSIVLQTWSGGPALQAARFRRGRDTDGGGPVPPPTGVPVLPLTVGLGPPPTVMPGPPLPTSTGAGICPDRHSPVLVCTMVPFGWRVHVWSSAAPPARGPCSTAAMRAPHPLSSGCTS